MPSENIKVTLTVNGQVVTVNCPSNTRLLDLLRDYLHLTGTKEGCGIGECGACTVIMDNKAVNSCLVLAGSAQGSEIITIEGMETKDGLHPIQKAFVKNNAIQCGYCTSGMVMSAKVLLDENPKPTEEEIKIGISGNLCRCTGYKQIVDAIKEAAEAE